MLPAVLYTSLALESGLETTSSLSWTCIGIEKKFNWSWTRAAWVKLIILEGDLETVSFPTTVTMINFSYSQNNHTHSHAQYILNNQMNPLIMNYECFTLCAVPHRGKKVCNCVHLCSDLCNASKCHTVM